MFPLKSLTKVESIFNIWVDCKGLKYRSKARGVAGQSGEGERVEVGDGE